MTEKLEPLKNCPRCNQKVERYAIPQRLDWGIKCNKCGLDYSDEDDRTYIWNSASSYSKLCNKVSVELTELRKLAAYNLSMGGVTYGNGRNIELEIKLLERLFLEDGSPLQQLLNSLNESYKKHIKSLKK